MLTAAFIRTNIAKKKKKITSINHTNDKANSDESTQQKTAHEKVHVTTSTLSYDDPLLPRATDAKFNSDLRKYPVTCCVSCIKDFTALTTTNIWQRNV